MRYQGKHLHHKNLMRIPSHIEKLLACPNAHLPIRVFEERIVCDQCGFEGQMKDGVAIMMESSATSYFDDKYEVMQAGHEGGSPAWNFGYKQQVRLFESYLKPGMTVLDVGCGPTLLYQPPKNCSVIGLEPSFNSIRANKNVQVRLQASAAGIPLASHSVDCVVCFYSIHHMVGTSISDTRTNVHCALKEFGRVLRNGGELFIFEMTPMYFFAMFQNLLWNQARSRIPNLLDMYFWQGNDLRNAAAKFLPTGSLLKITVFRDSVFTVFPPVFSLPWLKIPRFLYPLTPKLYQWKMPN